MMRDTVGIKLLKKMGWKLGQGTGPRVTKMQKKRLKEEYKKTQAKLFGCSRPQDANIKRTDQDSESSTDDENDGLTFAPDDYQTFLCKPKVNVFGLGYYGLDKREILGSHINLFEPTPLKIEEKKKKLLITGQAFGVGAFEEDDDDIYACENMSQYDFSMDTKPTTAHDEKQQSSIISLNYTEGVLTGFVISTKAITRKKCFPPPELPQEFRAVRVRKSRFEPISAKATSMSNMKENSKDLKKKVLQHHNLTANDRAHILSETPQKSVTQEDKVNSQTREEHKTDTSETLKLPEKLVLSTKTECTQFRPFIAHPEKQQRYEQYLALCKVGQKDQVSCLQPSTMTEWEKERERSEFERAAYLYQPLTGILNDRFVSASVPEDFNGPVHPLSGQVDNASKQKTTEKVKMFGSMTREETDWRPCSLLCKRFNIPELYSRVESSSTTQKSTSTSKFSIFSSLEALSFKTATKSQDNTTHNKLTDIMSSTSEQREVTPKKEPEPEPEPESEISEVEPVIIEEAPTEYRSENSALEFPDPPAKIDLYKAIFLSSSDDSDTDSEKEPPHPSQEVQSPDITLTIVNRNVNLSRESNRQEDTQPSHQVTSSDLTNTERNESQSRESSTKSYEKEKSNVLEKQQEMSNNNEVTSHHSSMQVRTTLEDNMYGPQLPTVSTSVPKNCASVSTVSKALPSVVASVNCQWVEKTKQNSHKNKHKKHKKSSKHKKHKHKKKRH
ncbi:G patch domain-containing protein 1 isoform X2 [Periplaneta americana]|uniref:G patch domain-containing protein 1 isoform X2 n=1 Tax=Periplaneta americana TaxID=6978 RepID=UPI0037E90FBA